MIDESGWNQELKSWISNIEFPLYDSSGAFLDTTNKNPNNNWSPDNIMSIEEAFENFRRGTELTIIENRWCDPVTLLDVTRSSSLAFYNN